MTKCKNGQYESCGRAEQRKMNTELAYVALRGKFLVKCMGFGYKHIGNAFFLLENSRRSTFTTMKIIALTVGKRYASYTQFSEHPKQVLYNRIVSSVITARCC